MYNIKLSKRPLIFTFFCNWFWVCLLILRKLKTKSNRTDWKLGYFDNKWGRFVAVIGLLSVLSGSTDWSSQSTFISGSKTLYTVRDLMLCACQLCWHINSKYIYQGQHCDKENTRFLCSGLCDESEREIVSAVIVRAEGLALARLLSVSTHSNSPGWFYNTNNTQVNFLIVKS